MLKRITCVGLSLILSLSAFADAASDSAAADASLAERLASTAQGTLAGKDKLAPEDWQQALSLFQAASRLNPDEPRFHRMIAETNLKMGDRKAALTALREYCKVLKDEPDLSAQLQIIDLYSAEMETADAKLKYFNDLLSAPIPDELKSRVALRIAQLHGERSEQAQAQELIKKSLELDPLNPESLAAKYQSLIAGDPVERLAVLLQMVRSNPRQPDVMIRVGDELAAAGLHSEAANWFSLALSMNARLQLQPRLDYIESYCASLLLSGQAKFARATAESVLQNLPTNADAMFIKLVVDKQGGDVDQQTRTLADATSAVLENLYAMHRKIMGGDSPTTKPAGELAERLPDLNALAAKAKQSGDQAVIDALSQTLTDLAWLQIYFAKTPQNVTPVIEAIKVLVPADSVTVPRLEGWAFLVAGKTEEAKVKLSAIADRDLLAKMGMVRLNAAADAAKAKTDANALIADNASGLVGVLLVDGLKDIGGVVAAGPSASALKEKLDAFPKDWLDIIDKPQNFYIIRADAGRVKYEFDEPVFANVEIVNNGKYDLEIGDSGALRPDLWFDCTLHMNGPNSITGAAYDRISKRFVLKKGETMQQQVRLDQYPKLYPAISNNPIVAMQMYFTVFTNPTPVGNGVGPGPAGYRLTLRKVVERGSTAVLNQQVQQKLSTMLSSGTPDEKMRTATLLSTLAAAWSKEDAPDQLKKLARQLLESVDDLRGSSILSVRGWAMVQSALVRSAEPRKQGVLQMMGDANWTIRLLGAMVAETLPKPEATAVLQTLVGDSDETVANFAKATIVVVKNAVPPATQPASQPATTPSAPTAANK